MWLELTMAGSWKVWVNMDRVEYMYTVREGTQLVFSGSRRDRLQVHEPPNVIAQRLKLNVGGQDVRPQDATLIMNVAETEKAA